MAFTKYAKASVVCPSISIDEWIKKSTTKFSNRTANNDLLSQYKPSEYLLSHCTIIASVDTEVLPNIKIGKIVIDGFEINRMFDDYSITLDTQKYINGNDDSWERKLLLNTFKTFIGGENYLEHIQILALSKGKVIDAIARDLGDSIYIDILVATHRKHKNLIQSIVSGELCTLSMGCEIEFSICSCCGNVAHDDTELCPHIKYFKGSTFTDTNGQIRKIAELCGHHSDIKSVVFKEASWVEDPAFVGAVVQHILNPDILDMSKISIMLANAYNISKPDKTSELKKIASVFHKAADEDIDIDEDNQDDNQDENLPSEDDYYGEEETPDMNIDFGGENMQVDDMDVSYDQLVTDVREKVLKDVWDEIIETTTDPVVNQFTENENDTLVEGSKQYEHIAYKVRKGVRDFKKFGWKYLDGDYSGLELLLIAKKAGIDYSFDEFKTLLKVGSLNKYNNNKSSFLKKTQYNFNKNPLSRSVKRILLGGYLLNMSKR
jgi:hypothetical protein